jgi:hypothetical protein
MSCLGYGYWHRQNDRIIGEDLRSPGDPRLADLWLRQCQKIFQISLDIRTVRGMMVLFPQSL